MHSFLTQWWQAPAQSSLKSTMPCLPIGVWRGGAGFGSMWYFFAMGGSSLGARQEAGLLDDLGDGLLPLDGHDVDARDPFHPPQFLDGLDADPDALGARLLALELRHPVDDLLGDVHAGDLVAHVAGH